MGQVTGPTRSCGVPTVEVVVVQPIDVAAVPRLHALLDDAIALNPRELIVDLTSCPFLDRTAVGLLLDIHRRVHHAGSLLTLRLQESKLTSDSTVAPLDRARHVAGLEPAGGRLVAGSPAASGLTAAAEAARSGHDRRLV